MNDNATVHHLSNDGRLHAALCTALCVLCVCVTHPPSDKQCIQIPHTPSHLSRLVTYTVLVGYKKEWLWKTYLDVKRTWWNMWLLLHVVSNTSLNTQQSWEISLFKWHSALLRNIATYSGHYGSDLHIFLQYSHEQATGTNHVHTVTCDRNQDHNFRVHRNEPKYRLPPPQVCMSMMWELWSDTAIAWYDESRHLKKNLGKVSHKSTSCLFLPYRGMWGYIASHPTSRSISFHVTFAVHV